jgi:LysM repeat protein
MEGLWLGLPKWLIWSNKIIKNMRAELIIKHIASLIVVWAMCAIEPTHAQQVPKTTTINGKIYILHTVEKGEGAMAVARKYNITLNDLANANQVNLDKLYRNQVLKIPVPDTVTTNIEGAKTTLQMRDTSSIALVHANAQEIVVKRTPSQVHTVQPGETLNKIAQQYGVSITELQNWNSISGNKITVGQKLKINPFINQAPHKPWNIANRPNDPVIFIPINQVIEEFVNVKVIEGDIVFFHKHVSGNVMLIEAIYEQGVSILVQNIEQDKTLPSNTIKIGGNILKRLGNEASLNKLLIKYTE